MNSLQRALASLAVLALLCVGLWWLGFSQGKTSRDKHYQPIFEQITAKANVAKGRIEGIRKASAALIKDQEKRSAERLQAIHHRATRAEQRIVSLLQVGAGRCREPVPGSAGASPFAEPAAEELERFGRVGAGIAAVGRRCEEDAGQLAELQRWYATQRDFLGH